MSGHQLPSFISWQWELSKTWTSKCPGRARDDVGMFFQPSALVFSCFEGVRRLTVVATVTVNSDTLYAHVIKRGADRLHYTVSVRKCVFKRFRVYIRVSYGVWEETQLKFRPGSSLTPPPAVPVLALDDFAEFHVLVGDLLSPTLAGILQFNDQQSLPSSGSVTITSTLPPL